MTTIDRCRVESVETVPGKRFESYWKNPMQVVTTNMGTFIDNMPGVKFMGKKDVYPGFDWKQFEGEEVGDFKIINCCGHKWINKKS